MHVRDQRRKHIALKKMPDGSVLGPTEYFAQKEQRYLAWISKLELALSDKLKQLIKNQSNALLPYDPSLPSPAKSAGEPCNHLFKLSPDNSFDNIRLILSISKPLSHEQNRIYLMKSKNILIALDISNISAVYMKFLTL